MTVDWIDFRFPGVRGVRCAFGRRPATDVQGAFAGNISYDTQDDPARILAARRALRDGLGFGQWLELRQVHGTRMVFGHGPAGIGDGTGGGGEVGTGLDAPGSIDADGHGASRAEGAGRALVIKTADCQPVLLAHSSGDFVAALHVGWRANAAKFIASGVAQFCSRYGLNPTDLHAVRGPSLGPQWSEFVNFSLEWPEEFEPWFNAATRTMDLWRLTRDQLAALGLNPANIHAIDHCTRTDDAYFSHRRGDRGRQASAVWME